MPPIEDYALAYLVGEAESLQLPDSFLRDGELLTALTKTVAQFLSKFDANMCIDVSALSDKLASLLEKGKVFDFSSDDWAGRYVRYRANRYPKFREQFLAANPIHAKSQLVGKRFYPDAFRNYADREIANAGPAQSAGYVVEDYVVADYVESDVAPAADRIVAFSHNAPEYQEIAQGIADVQEHVRSANDLTVDEAEKDRISKGLAAAAALWEATQLKVIQVKVGILMAVQEAVVALGATAKAVSVALLVDAIKAFVRNHTGIDLDKI